MAKAGSTSATLTRQRKSLFLEGLRKTGTVWGGATYAKITRDAVYKWLRKDKRFVKSVENVKLECVEICESSMFQDGIKGHQRARECWLRAHDPARYGDQLRLSGKLSLSNWLSEQWDEDPPHDPVPVSQPGPQ